MILNHIWIFVLIICILPSKQQLCTFSWRPSPFLELYLKCFALFTLSKIFPSCIFLPIFNGADSASHLRSILAMLLGKNIKETNEPIPPLPYLSISIFYQEKYRCKLFLIQRKHWQVLWVEKNSKLLGCSRLSWIPAARSKVTWETAALEEIHIPRISNYTETGFRVTHTRDLWFPFFFGFRDSFRNRDRSAFSALFNHNVRLMSVFITKWVIWYFLHGHALNLCCNCFKTQPMNE